MKAILFDLDNTLYSPERQLFSLIDVRINRFMNEVVGIPSEEVDGLRRRYWAEYGVTLQGLIRHHAVDPEHYLEYVHDVDVSQRLDPDPELRRALQQVSQRKVVFTNGSMDHAHRVLATLQIEDLFEEIFDIRVARYMPKPFQAPYDKVLDRLELAGSDCVMVEDSTDNLRTAKDMGMKTVLVGPGICPAYADVQIPVASAILQALTALDQGPAPCVSCNSHDSL